MPRILVIDDEASFRNALRGLLERAGHQVFEAENGAAGMQWYREHGADLVITDLYMPEQDGIQTIRLFRQEFPEGKIIVISGGERSGSMDLRAYAELLGATRALEKQFEPADLLAVVGEALGPRAPP